MDFPHRILFVAVTRAAYGKPVVESREVLELVAAAPSDAVTQAASLRGAAVT